MALKEPAYTAAEKMGSEPEVRKFSAIEIADGLGEKNILTFLLQMRLTILRTSHFSSIKMVPTRFETASKTKYL